MAMTGAVNTSSTRAAPTSSTRLQATYHVPGTTTGPLAGNRRATTAGVGRAASSVLGEFSTAALLSEYMLGDPSGLFLCQRLVQDWQRLPQQPHTRVRLDGRRIVDGADDVEL